MGKSKRTDSTTTVEQLFRLEQALRHRLVLLRLLQQELEHHVGSANGEHELLAVGDGSYEPPRTDVVEQLRHELIVAQARARDGHRRLLDHEVVVADEVPGETFS